MLCSYFWLLRSTIFQSVEQPTTRQERLVVYLSLERKASKNDFHLFQDRGPQRNLLLALAVEAGDRVSWAEVQDRLSSRLDQRSRQISFMSSKEFSDPPCSFSALILHSAYLTRTSSALPIVSWHTKQACQCSSTKLDVLASTF